MVGAILGCRSLLTNSAPRSTHPPCCAVCHVDLHACAVIGSEPWLPTVASGRCFDRVFKSTVIIVQGRVVRSPAIMKAQAVVFSLVVVVAVSRVAAGPPEPDLEGVGLSMTMSSMSVKDAMDKVEAIVRERGFGVAARVDHAAGKRLGTGLFAIRKKVVTMSNCCQFGPYRGRFCQCSSIICPSLFPRK